MKKLLTLFALTSLFCCHLQAFGTHDILHTQSPSEPPLREMRAVWLTTIGGIDWPHSYSQSAVSARKQQAEFCTILDNLAKAGINTVLLQTRIRATTIFQSDLEPWDGCLSGFPGKSPGYDALAFAIEECHKRGMKLHAWIVTIPVGKWNGTGCKALRKSHPELLKRIGDEGFMNPESSMVGDYLAAFCKDIVSRYDVDGIHLDYIRYPETWKVIKDKEEGRRNITSIVRKISHEVKQQKPWVMMSCSPVGKYADTKRSWSHGWNARDIVCQDAVLWLQEGLMDCLFPMMYFRGENFYPFAIDWKERSNGRIITPGLGIYFLSPREKNWALEDITREMHVLRQYDMGVCMFRSKFFTDNTKGLYDYTAGTFSPLPALQPAMTWYDTPAPSAPLSITKRQNSDGSIRLSWSESPSTDGNAMHYNIYGDTTFPVDTRKASNLLMADYRDTIASIPMPGNVIYYAVTATDRYGNESEPIQTDSHNANAEQQQDTKMPLEYSDGRIILEGYDVTEGQLTEIRTIMGNRIALSTVQRKGDKTFILAPSLPAGHYSLYFINRKNHSHKLGLFGIAP